MKSLALRSFSMMFAMLMLSVFSVSVSAQEATSPADNSPNPEECTYEARTIEEMQTLVGTLTPAGAGEAASSALESTPVAMMLPAGTPADDASIEGVTTTIRLSFACHNAGDYLASFTGTTDEFIVSQVGLMLFDEEFVAAMEGEPVALAEEDQTQMLGVREVTAYEDGRVGALVDYFGPTSPPAEGPLETDLWIFENVDGVWLLDEVVENLESTHGPDMTATPAA